MKSYSPEYFAEPRRQPTVAIIVFVYNFVMRMLKGFWPILLVLLVNGGGRSNYEIWTNIAIGGFGGFSLIISIVSYFRYYYFIADDSLVIHKGVFTKQRLSLPFDRIQNINLEQKLVHRIFGVYMVKVDSAGSAGNEISIDALTRDEAEWIRDYILDKKSTLLVEGDDDIAQAENVGIAHKEEQEIMRLTPLDLLKVGVSQNHLRMAGILIGLSFGFAQTIEDITQLNIWKIALDNAESLSAKSVLIFLGGIFTFFAVLLVIAFLITLVRTVIRYFDLRLVRILEGFRLSSGLINRREAALRLEKVQVVTWADNPIRRWLKIFTLEVKQASAGKIGKQQESFKIPGCYKSHVDEVIHASFPDVVNQEFQTYKIDRRFTFRRVLYFSFIPGLILSSIYFLGANWNWLIFGMMWIIGSWIYFWRYRTRYWWKVSNEYIQVHKGAIGSHYSLMPYYKIQAIELVANIYQRRKDLTDVVIYTAGGSIRIPYVPYEQAATLRDYVLYKVESDNKSWM